MEKRYRAVLFFSDGSSEDMYGELNNNQVDEIHKQMKRPKNKRLYRLGVNWSVVDKVEIKEI